MREVFLSHQSMVNRQSRIIATRLVLNLPEAGSMADAVGALNALASVWPAGDKPLFVSCGKANCTAELLDWSPPRNAVIEIPAASLVGERGSALLGALQVWQPSICLQFDPAAVQALSAAVQFRFIGFDAQQFSLSQLKMLGARTRALGIGIAFNVENSEDFHACLDAGLSAACGWFFTKAINPSTKTLTPGQANIVRVLNLVRKNAEIREIEAILRQDVAISYKLLRYINSAGFGLSCEIQSFRHAVSILGYDKLNRWLSLLLATASKDPMATALTHTALWRARLLELLAQGLVDRSEYDNLFITGAFSLLDVLLGVGMERVLETMRLPDVICDALLGNGGRYGPFLDLALASERADGAGMAEQAAMLGLRAETVNRAQLQALAFAESMEF